MSSNVNTNWRNASDDYDKGDLKDELKASGFSDCVSDLVADIVDKKATSEWTQMLARQEAMRQIDILMDGSRTASQNFRQRVGTMAPTVGATTTGTSTSATY